MGIVSREAESWGHGQGQRASRKIGSPNIIDYFDSFILNYKIYGVR